MFPHDPCVLMTDVKMSPLYTCPRVLFIFCNYTSVLFCSFTSQSERPHRLKLNPPETPCLTIDYDTNPIPKNKRVQPKEENDGNGIKCFCMVRALY